MISPSVAETLGQRATRAFSIAYSSVGIMNLAADPVVPKWMHAASEPGPGGSGPPAGSGKRVSGFSQEAAHSLFSLLERMLFQETTVGSEGMLQSLDPRAKLLCALVLLVAVSFVQNLWLLGGLYAGVLVVALVSGVDGFLFLKRVWFFVPVFTGAMALPATLSWVTPGNPLWTLHQFDQELRLGSMTLPATLAITDTGLAVAGRFVFRVAVSVSVVVLLVMTTRWQGLLRALRVLGVPHFFVFALHMCYRYIHLLLRLLLDLHLGRRSRTLRRSRWMQDQAWMANRAGYLFKRSERLSESVYQAMLSRGFQGEPKLLDDPQWQGRDIVAMTCVAGLCLAMVLLSR
jgi:cobalt/nickel transport system permease protein